MNVFVYGERELVVVECKHVVAARASVVSTVECCDIAIAPLLQRKVKRRELAAPRLGTLIFHPSLLPRHRGRDAIRWAFKMGESYSGATWFWADDGYDTGPICEQEVLAIVPDERPRDFYERAVVPSAVRMLRYILDDLAAGIVRRRPQIEEHASTEGPYVRDPRPEADPVLTSPLWKYGGPGLDR